MDRETYPPLIAVITTIWAPASRGVSNLARAPSTNTLRCRRNAGLVSHSRSRTPGWRALTASIASPTVAAATASSPGQPGNSPSSAGGKTTRTSGIGRQPSSTSVSTEEITGR